MEEVMDLERTVKNRRRRSVRKGYAEIDSTNLGATRRVEKT